MKNNDLLAWMQSRGIGSVPTQAPAFGGIANPAQRAVLRRSDTDYLAARQKELDAYEAQRAAYNTGLAKYQEEVYKPYQAQADAYNAAAQKYNTDVYNPYRTQYEAYEKAVADYNAGPRTTDYAGPAEPTLASKFDMAMPTAPGAFSLTSPVLPFKEEDVVAYQKEAAQTAQSDAENRGVAIDVVSDPSKYNFGSMSVSNRFMAEGGPVDAEPSGQARSMMDQMTGLVASAGRGGDTQLAHLSPQSADLLKSQGGAGTINPKTGLPEYLVMTMSAEDYDTAAKTNFRGMPLGGYQRGAYSPGYLEGLAAAEEAKKKAAADAAAAALAESQRRDLQNAAAEKAIAERLAKEKADAEVARLATEREAARIYASRVRDQRVASPVVGTVASTVRPVASDYSFNTRASTPLSPVDLDNRYIRTPTAPIGSRTPTYASPNPSQQPRDERPAGPTTLPTFIENDLTRIPTAAEIAMPDIGRQKSAITNPKNFFALDPSKPPSIPGLLPGTVALAPLDLPVAAGKKTLEAIAANPNLSPQMLGGRENARIMTDRLGNRIYSPGAAPLLYRSGGEVTRDLNALLAQNTETLSDEVPDEVINTNPVGTAQKMLADLGNLGKVSPVRQSIKRVRTAPGGGATADKSMQMPFEGLGKGDLGAMKDVTPAAKNTDSARAQMEELARVYQLKIRAAQDKGKGLSADTFGAPTLEQPTLTKSRLTKKRFKDGGEAKKPGAEGAKEPSIFSVKSYATDTSERMFPDQMGEDDERDAARHMLAAATLSRKFGPGTAEFLGKVYERTSSPESFFSMFGIGKPREDYEMDVHNNKVGVGLGSRATSQEELEKLVRAMAMQSQNKQVEGKPWTMSDEQQRNRKPREMTPRPEYRAEGSPVEGELSQEEIDAASRPAFVTPKSGKGRKQGEISRQLQSGDAYINMAKGVTELPYDLAGAPVDLATMAMRPFGYGTEKPVMGSDWIKQQMTDAKVRPEPPADPTAKGFYTAGELLSNLVNPAGVTRAGVKAAEKTGKAVTDVAKDFQQYNRQLVVPGASYVSRAPGGYFPTSRGMGEKTAEEINNTKLSDLPENFVSWLNTDDKNKSSFLGLGPKRESLGDKYNRWKAETGNKDYTFGILSGVDKSFRPVLKKITEMESGEKRDALFQMFNQKAKDFYSKQAGSIQDPLRADILGGNIKFDMDSKMGDVFPQVLVKQAAQGDLQALRLLEKNYDNMIGIKAVVPYRRVPSRPEDIAPPNTLKRQIIESVRDNLDSIPDSQLLAYASKKPLPGPDGVAKAAKEVRLKLKENPNLFSTVLEPNIERTVFAKESRYSDVDMARHPSLYGTTATEAMINPQGPAFTKDQFDAMETVPQGYFLPELETAISKNQPILDAHEYGDLKLLGLDPQKLLQEANRLSAKDLNSMGFTDFLKKAYKSSEEVAQLEKDLKRVKPLLQQGKLPPANVMLFGVKDFLPTVNDMRWVKVTNPDGVKSIAAGMNNSVASYATSETYGALGRGRRALDSGEVEVYALYDKNHIPHVTVEYGTGKSSVPEKQRSQILQLTGNGPLTANESSNNYAEQIAALVNALPIKNVTALPASTQKILKNNFFEFKDNRVVRNEEEFTKNQALTKELGLAKGGLVDKNIAFIKAHT